MHFTATSYACHKPVQAFRPDIVLMTQGGMLLPSCQSCGLIACDPTQERTQCKAAVNAVG